MNFNRAILLSRARLVVIARAGASQFFTAVLIVSDLGIERVQRQSAVNAVQALLSNK
jgi:hypothetical protein